MYFYKYKGKQCLDLRGNLILSHNDNLIKARVSSAAPSAVKNGRFILDITRRGIWYKWRATLAAIRFIWGPNQELTKESIERDGL